jgi:hypothetical protein
MNFKDNHGRSHGSVRTDDGPPGKGDFVVLETGRGEVVEVEWNFRGPGHTEVTVLLVGLRAPHKG